MTKTSIKVALIIVVFLLSIKAIGAETDSLKTSNNFKSYSLIIQDSPVGLTTMRQSDENYLSVYRLLSNVLYKNVNPKTGYIIQVISELFLYPLTHEEGHRSILTSLGIGSISQPLYNLQGIAYVNGVRDAELQNLRDNDLPDYIRLHTAGIESDYMLGNKAEEDIVFNFDSKRNLFVEVYFRKLLTMAYYTGSLIPSFSPNLKENTNELENDIVGHDVYGAIKNLHRPNIPFYRYTDYKDMTSEEQKFVERVGYRALLNLASPVFFKPLNIIKNENLKLSVSTGYTMCPFGDFIDENFLIQYHQKYNIHAYLRQFENRNTWFMGGGISLIDYQISPKFNTTIAAHLWNQPKNLDFNTTESQFGGSGDLLFRYIILENQSHNSMSIDLGLNYKTVGFLPEEVIMKEHVGVRLGVTVNLNQN
ncbi:MAG: hypothetical protein WCK78_02725 [Paludibacter sp.]